MKKVSLFSFGLAIVLLSSGCVSVRVKTDLVPETDAKLKSPAGIFYIAGLEYGYVDDEPLSKQRKLYASDYGKKLLRILRKECPSRYQLLFSEREESAIPLFVTVKEDTNYFERGKINAWIFCTLLITPLILPMPIEVDRDLTVSVSTWSGAEGQGIPAVRKKFHREERAWFTMLTPVGLITIPGESDFPKESHAFYMGPDVWDDVPQVAQQMATALAKMIESKEPEFWTAAPRRTQQPGYAPVPANTTAPVPLPTEPIQPF